MLPGTLRPNAAGLAFGRLRRWLDGSTITGASQSAGVWSVALQSASSGREHVVWSPDGPARYVLPGSGRAHVTSIDGTSAVATGTITIGPGPVRVR